MEQHHDNVPAGVDRAHSRAVNNGSPFSLQAVNLWWSEDRLWCVATEVDRMWIYIGGTEACINEILEEHRLETRKTVIDDRVDIKTDQINK